MLVCYKIFHYLAVTVSSNNIYLAGAERCVQHQEGAGAAVSPVPPPAEHQEHHRHR